MPESDIPVKRITDVIFPVSEAIRYIAIYRNGELFSSMKQGLSNASSSESDKYEELIVNPTLLKLVTQRGNIDCGGARYVLIRYGNFYEFVRPVNEGHLSVGFQLNSNPSEIIEGIEKVLRELSY